MMNSPHNDDHARMPLMEALAVIKEVRGDDTVVVTNMVSARTWPALSDHRLDFNYGRSAMGGAVPLALGVALAQPHREVIVVSGDGSLLMSLGCLVTVTCSGATNLSIVLLDNGIYEVTGGQKTPAHDPGVDFAALATAAGFPHVVHSSELSPWQRQAASLLQSPGPRLAWLEVARCETPVSSEPAGSIDEHVARFGTLLRGESD